MDAMTIEWHKRGLKNSREYEKHLSQILENTIISKTKQLRKLIAENEYHEFQIKEAEKEKKKSFNSELYRKKYRKNYEIIK